MTPQQKERIRSALDQAGATGPCFRCGSTEFSLLAGYFNPILEHRPGEATLGGENLVGVPTVVLVCRHCGLMSQHAINMLNIEGDPSPGAQYAGA